MIEWLIGNPIGDSKNGLHLRQSLLRFVHQQTALMEIELSLLEFAVSITRSVHAIEVSVVRDRISRSVS
jgi:hypothetical protein